MLHVLTFKVIYELILKHFYYIPYSRKDWWEESLTNLASEQCFAKLKSSKSFVPYKAVLALRNSPDFFPYRGNFANVSSCKCSSYTVYDLPDPDYQLVTSKAADMLHFQLCSTCYTGLQRTLQEVPNYFEIVLHSICLNTCCTGVVARGVGQEKVNTVIFAIINNHDSKFHNDRKPYSILLKVLCFAWIFNSTYKSKCS